MKASAKLGTLTSRGAKEIFVRAAPITLNDLDGILERGNLLSERQRGSTQLGIAAGLRPLLDLSFTAEAG